MRYAKTCTLLILTLFATASLSRATDSPKNLRPPIQDSAAPAPSAPPQVCFSVSEAGRIATSQVEALQAIKRLRGELQLERAKRPSRFGWTLGAGMGLGYDFQYQRVDVEPFVGIMYGIRW